MSHSSLPTPRDELELTVLEHTGYIDIAEHVADAVQRILEAHAELLAPIMGVPAEMLMPDLWEGVQR